jgi:hypothetical protein
MKDFKVRPETETSALKCSKTLEHIGIGNDFLNRIQMAQQLRERIDEWNYMKLKSFCTVKEIVTKMKRQSTEWEKIFASNTTDKELITRIQKPKLPPKINDPMKK